MPTKDPDDELVACRICGQPIQPGEARYRDAHGDAHVACHDAEERPPHQPGTEPAPTEDGPPTPGP